MRHFKQLLYLIVVIYTLFFASVIYAEKTVSESIELYTVDYPPYTIVTADGVLTGVDVDIVKAAFSIVGINAIIKTAPWKRILKNIEHGYFLGAITCSKRPERTKYANYSDQTSDANQVAVMAKDTDDSELVLFSDLKKFEVIVVDGWGVQGELKDQGLEYTSTSEVESGINAVVNRGVDIFYNGEMTSLYRARQLGVQDKIKIKRFQDKDSTAFHVCFSKKNRDSQRLITQFNMGLSLIKDNGTYQAIYDKYLH